MTSPKRYALIKDMPELYKTYAKRIGVDPAAEVAAMQEEFLADQKKAKEAEHVPHLATLPGYWDKYHGGALTAEDAALKTGIDAAAVKELTAALVRVPGDVCDSSQGEEAVRAADGDGRRASGRSTTEWRSCWRLRRW